MKPTEFNPYVRYAARILEPKPYPELICAYDHRLFYIENGSISIEFADQILPLYAGDVITIPPALPYRLLFPAQEKLLYYVLNFDFESTSYGTQAHTPQPIPYFDKNEVFSTASFPPFDTIYLRHHAESLCPLLDEIYTEFAKETPQAALISSALLKYVLSKMISSSQPSSGHSHTEVLIRDIKEYIQKNICSTVTNNSVAEHFDYHPYYLNSLFLKQEGLTLHKYITEVKLRKAKELLVSTNQAVYEIAAACGFQGASYFSEVFTRQSGITPTQYRERSK